MTKKQIRSNFRISVFSRDGQKCRKCGRIPSGIDEDKLDAHHITNRDYIHNGGYVLENGISLCPECHRKAEDWYQQIKFHEGFSPVDLYILIGSSYDKATAAAKRCL